MIVTALLFPNLLRGQGLEADSLLSISELKRALHAEDMPGDSNKVFKTSGIANIASGQLHETYFQIYIQNDSVGTSLFGYKIATPVSVGDSVVVTGSKQMYHGEPELRVNRYKVYPKDSLSITPVALSNVIEKPSDYTGMLVEGSGIIKEKGHQFNGKYLMVAESDTSEKSIMIYVPNYHSQYQNFDFRASDVGEEVHFKGVLGKYDPTYPKRMRYKILLRNSDDYSHGGWPQFYFKYIALILAGLILLSVGWMILLRRQVKQKTRALQESLEEKEVLLIEIHHRVKNNLASISGLLQLQSDMTEDANVQNALQESQTRINSMMLVHEKLYKSTSFKNIRIQKYLEDLAGSIKSTVAAGTSAIDIKVEAETIDLETDKVIPMGLLVNELLVNAFKHAFADKNEGIIWISLKQHQDIITLKVEDNGKGLPENLNEKYSDSLGMLLINTFAQQLNARETVKNTPGACFIFDFPV